MRTHSHLKTVAAMDELETAIFLPRAQTDAMLGLSTAAAAAGNGNGKSDAACHHVVVCAGQVGVLRLYHVYYKPTASKGKGSNAASAFTCVPLVNIAPSGPSLQHTISFRPGAAASSGNNGGGDDDDDQKDRELAGGKAAPGSFTSVDNLIFRPSLADGEAGGDLTVVTADQTFVTYALSSVVDEQQQGGKRKGKAGGSSSSSRGGLTFSLERQLLGARDDILDMSILAVAADKAAASSSSSSSVQAKTSFTAVVATNSPHLRALELSPKSSSSSSSSCRLLYGHSDVVLAVSSAPNGYVLTFLYSSSFIYSLLAYLLD